MDSAKNKRLLLAACQANGIALPDGAPPSYMQARILGLRPAKVARTDEDAAPSTAPASTISLNKTTFVEDETQRIGASLGGVTVRNKPQLTLEAESRYEEIKSRLKKDDDLFLENVTPDMAEQLKASGWLAIIVEPSGTYFRKPAAPVAKSPQPEKAADILSIDIWLSDRVLHGVGGYQRSPWTLRGAHNLLGWLHEAGRDDVSSCVSSSLRRRSQSL